MKVFKFGGASVKNADAVKNVASIIQKFPEENIMVIISAMGKMTNALEELTDAFLQKTPTKQEVFTQIKAYHMAIINDLFTTDYPAVTKDVEQFFNQFNLYINGTPNQNEDLEYSAIVSMGEIISTKIVHHYLNYIGLTNKWVDARDCVKTTGIHFKEAQVDWEVTSYLINHDLRPYFGEGKGKIAITQGFIAGTTGFKTTTLGREGSDYSAAIFAFALDAENMTIWKDVPGFLNADPKYFEDTKKLDAISYREAIELAYYGATIIHPKTLKPLQNKAIPLHVKSFINPDAEGSIIQSSEEKDGLIPSYIFKMSQVLFSISPTDFSFIDEKNLITIIGIFAKHQVKLNLMQHSALSFYVCVDHIKNKIPQILAELKENFQVDTKIDLELITIRHYDEATRDKVLLNKEVVLEQKGRTTMRIIVKSL